jgi:CheY-like chemotaxis protein
MSTTSPAASSRILIVDDTPANIQTLTATLKEKGYQISVALNGKQAPVCNPTLSCWM